MAQLPRGEGAEIGVWRGDFSALLLARVKLSRLHLIDPWTFVDTPAYSSACYGGAEARSQQDMDEIYAAVLRRFARQIDEGRVLVHRMTSADAAALIPDASLDWVYVDGNHLYEAVRQDLQMYLPKMRPEGVLTGDDYGVRGWWDDGVTKAVNQFASEAGWSLRVQGTQFILFP